MTRYQNSSMPLLITVGIPCYNQADLLPKTIQSVLNQQYANLEIIISDDASTDNTEKAVIEFLSDDRVKYYKNPVNIGRVKNYKKILYQYAKGSWYINVDGDDELTDENFIVDAVAEIKKHNNVVIACAACKRILDDKIDYVISSDYEQDPALVDGISFFLNIPTKKTWISHLTTLYNAELAKKLNFYNSNITSTDYESLYRLSLLGNVVVFKRIAGAWNIHGQNESLLSVTKINSVLKNFEYIENVSKFAENYISHQQNKQWRYNMIEGDLKSYLAFFVKSRPKNWFYNSLKIIKLYPLISVRCIPWFFKSVFKN